jgi:hypothetical protein
MAVGLGCSRFARRYSGNRVCFLFLRVLRCFSSPGLPPTTLWIQVVVPALQAGGLPHSEIPGSMLTYSSPRHIGVRPVLHRLLAPRHPPCALRSLAYINLLQVLFFGECNRLQTLVFVFWLHFHITFSRCVSYCFIAISRRQEIIYHVLKSNATPFFIFYTYFFYFILYV